MPKAILSLALLGFIAVPAQAVDFTDCPDLKGFDATTIMRAARQVSCITQKVSATKEDSVNQLAKGDEAAGNKVVGVLTKPTSRTSFSVTYKIPEQDLKPGERLYFGVPPDLADRPIRFVVLGHRQDPATETGTKPGEKWDQVPGLTSAQFHDKNVAGEGGWRFWEGQASGSKGAKFAEVRDTPELENLYEWAKYGHGSVVNGSMSKDPLHVDAMRLVSSGKDTVKISELTMKVLPPKPDRFLEHTFTPGTAFGDAETLKGQTFGGGQAYEGLFPGALPLRYGKGGDVPLPAGWKLEKNGSLRIPLPKGSSVTGLELAIGDSHDDKKRNSDGGWGTQGWARVNAYIRKKDGSSDVLLNQENVPPEGVVVGTPADGCYQIQEGDELVVNSQKDIAYLMGLRIWLNDPI